VEWTQSWWTVRGGIFDLSDVPNSAHLEPRLREFSSIGELEARYTLHGLDGKVKLLAFVNEGRMGSYADALALAQRTASTPDTALVRRFSSRAGLALNAEQDFTHDLSMFARVSMNDGRQEAYEFTDVNASLATGVSLRIARSKRADDVVGLATAINALSASAQRYLAAGGLGLLIGDGALRYAPETIVETYYLAHVTDHWSLSVDAQRIAHPAYNRDRGPVSVIGLRVHGEL